jgi:redox-sensitive bicupin YhaK (pirin superfamily)
MMRAKMSARPRVLADHGGLIYLLSGKLRLASGDEVVGLDAGQAIGFSNSEKDLEILVESMEESHFIFLSGKACHEPVVTHGGFIMNTQAEIASAIARYQSGEMGRLEPSRRST